MKFICKTQESNMQSFKGPSGLFYVSNRGIVFNVTNKLDIEHFKKNKRFSSNKKDAPKTLTEEDKLEQLLEKAGLKPADQKKIVEKYNTIGNLVSDVQQGIDLVKVYKLDKKSVDKLGKLIESYKG